MNDKNGKRINKPDAKRMLCRAIVQSYCKNELKTIKVDFVQSILDEYGFSRRSIHDTITANYHLSDREEHKKFLEVIHNFCFSQLADGSKIRSLSYNPF